MKHHRLHPSNPTAPLTTEATAEALGGCVSPWTLRRHVALGNVRVIRFGRRVFFPHEEIERIRDEGLPSLSSAKPGSKEEKAA